MPVRVRAHVTFANVVSLTALFVALSGGAYALTVPRNSVGSAQLKPNGSRPVTIDLCERHTTRDGRAVERVVDVDPTPQFLTLSRTPRVWPRVALNAARAARRPS